jgi:hypothetical protein
MSFKNQHHRYKRRIDKLWAPVSIEVMLQEGPEKKISVLKKAQQQAAKEILHLEEASAFIEFLESEIKKYQDELNNNDPNSTSQSAQSNEMLNTDESTQEAQNTLKAVDKINWRGTETQLVLLVDLLTQEAFLKYDRKWKMVAEHFLVQGKPTKSKNLSQSLENTLAGKTKDLKTLKEIISKVKKLED